MDTPWKDHTEHPDQPIFDVSPERLDSLSSSELADEMEQALDAMTEDTYDAAVIDAYLEALDRRAPMPEHPDAASAYATLHETLQTEFNMQAQVSASPKTIGRRRGILRAGLVAAITIACLFGGMVAAQAAGADVFGTLARWTLSAFSFGDIQSGNPAQQANISSMPADFPAEYQELWSELEARGVSSFMFPTYIPDGFQIESSNLYMPDGVNRVDFTVWYTNGDDLITFSILYGGGLNKIHEKDEKNVEFYESGDVEYYIFSNIEQVKAAWYSDELEYSLSTSLPVLELKKIIASIYQG